MHNVKYKQKKEEKIKHIVGKLNEKDKQKKEKLKKVATTRQG